MDEIARSGALMQIVDILRTEKKSLSELRL
jgi:hypothetical protein